VPNSVRQAAESLDHRARGGVVEVDSVVILAFESGKSPCRDDPSLGMQGHGADLADIAPGVAGEADGAEQFPGGAAVAPQIPELHRLVERSRRQDRLRRIDRNAADRGGVHFRVDAEDRGGRQLVALRAELPGWQEAGGGGEEQESLQLADGGVHRREGKRRSFGRLCPGEEE